MTTPVILVHGTWGLKQTWWKPSSAFAAGLVASGLGLASAEPFRWSGNLGGVEDYTPGDPEDPADDVSVDWTVEAIHLRDYARLANVYFGRPSDAEVSLVAHSHGGQVAILAIAHAGLNVRHLVTVATPVRKDLAGWQIGAQAAIKGSWLHLYGDWWRDSMIRLGELFDGNIGWKMKMPEALNIYVKGRGHSDLIDPKLFKDLDIWERLKE